MIKTSRRHPMLFRAACMVLGIAASGAAEANDRLPVRLRDAYARSRAEVQKYVRFLLVRVWKPKLERLRAAGLDPKRLRGRVEELVDEAVHLMLPHATRLMQDVVFATGATHLRITLPGRRALAVKGALAPPFSKDPKKALLQALAQTGGAAERELNDRLEQALLEDMEDLVQREAEASVGLPVVGRPRGVLRPLPDDYRQAYEQRAHTEVYRQAYYWLRKKRRFELAHLATAMSHEELDRARHRGPIWSLTSGASHEGWARNRLRIDFKWGYRNWEIHRRRIRRRIDQDLARATWAFARTAKELMSPGTQREVQEYLGRRLREELGKERTRPLAERYPRTRRELEQEMQRLRQELSPIFDRAMDRVPLPEDIRDLTREHGRRFAQEELQFSFGRAVQREAAPFAAAKRVQERLDRWVGESLARFDPGPGGPEEVASRAKAHVRRELAPRIERELEESLREAGVEEELWDQNRRRKALRVIRDRFEIDRQIDEAVERAAAGDQGDQEVR